MGHLYWSSQPSRWSHMVLISVTISSLFFNSSIIHLLCAAVVEAYFLLASDKNEWNIEWRDKLPDADNGFGCCVSIKCSDEMPSIDTDLFPPYYSYWICSEKCHHCICIIKTTQYILIWPSALECLTVLFSTVICIKDAQMWQIKC